jgi:hypothetical protein
MLQDPLLRAAVSSTDQTDPEQAFVFSMGLRFFMVGFLLWRIMNSLDNANSYRTGVVGQLCWAFFAVFQTGGLLQMTVADVDMNVYAKQHKNGVLAGIVYYGAAFLCTIPLYSLLTVLFVAVVLVVIFPVILTSHWLFVFPWHFSRNGNSTRRVVF